MGYLLVYTRSRRLVTSKSGMKVAVNSSCGAFWTTNRSIAKPRIQSNVEHGHSPITRKKLLYKLVIKMLT